MSVSSHVVQVDGKSSVTCYLMALDRCYASLCEKFERQRRRAASSNGAGPSGMPICCLPDFKLMLHLLTNPMRRPLLTRVPCIKYDAPQQMPATGCVTPCHSRWVQVMHGA